MTRRLLQFQGLNETSEEVNRLRQGKYSRLGNWDLGMICQHLTKTLRMSLEGAPFSLPFFLQPVARMILFKKIMRGQPTQLKLKTVAAFRPVEHPDIDKHIAEYETAVSDVMDHEAALLPKHPVFGRITKDEWRQFHCWHAAHHLSFLIPESSQS